MLKSHVLHNSTIKVKIGSCPTCDNGKKVPLIGGFCSSHYWQSRSKSPKKKEQKPIRRVSAKRSKENVQYLKVRLEFLNENQTCKCCGASATDVHHTKGRIGSLLTDKRYFVALCRGCHNRVEENPIWAKKHGYSKSRLNVQR